MYQTLIIGHGKYPAGILSAMELIMGKNDHVKILELSEELTHEKFEGKLVEFLKENPQVLIFADLTGGAPQQIAARVVLENQFSKEHFVISGMPISMITDLTMKFQFMGVPQEKAIETIEQSIQDSKDLIQCVSLDVM